MDNELTAWAEPSLADVPRDPLRARLDIHEESILLRHYGDRETWVRHVNADEMAAVMVQHTGTGTGLLPPNSLWWRHTQSGTVTALWREPRVWPVALQTKVMEPAERLMLPMPGLIFICAPGQSPWVFACERRPERKSETAYRMPAFNMFQDGRACPGNHEFPREVDRIPESFFQSHFSMTGDTHGRSTSHPGNLHELWKEIDGKDEYPTEDLVEQCKIGDLLEIPR